MSDGSAAGNRRWSHRQRFRFADRLRGHLVLVSSLTPGFAQIAGERENIRAVDSSFASEARTRGVTLAGGVEVDGDVESVNGGAEADAGSQVHVRARQRPVTVYLAGGSEVRGEVRNAKVVAE